MAVKQRRRPLPPIRFRVVRALMSGSEMFDAGEYDSVRRRRAYTYAMSEALGGVQVRTDRLRANALICDPRGHRR